MIWQGRHLLYGRAMKYSIAFIIAAAPVFADAPVIENITYSDGQFNVTLSHADTGWEDYADGWRVELADGTILGTRVLGHPHVEEQPFTRSSSFTVPEGVTDVLIRASTNSDGWAEDTTLFTLP